MIKKIINVGGESLGIRFTKQEREIYGIVEGDTIDLGDMLIQESIKQRRTKNVRENKKNVE